MATVAWIDRQEAVRTLESRLIRSLTLARLGGGAVMTEDGRFRVRRMLGRGASGVVCAAEDSKIGREVALKLYPGLADDALAAGVRAEARALGRLRHANVVTVHDFDASVLRPGEIGCFYVSMELLGGPSLRRWLSQGPGLSRAIELLCRAGDGLAAAHAAGLVHRDVKPENVMLDGETPKIVDFGLARETVVTTGVAERQQRAIVGTLAYMAPEALEGRADARSDVFSFAAMVWEACYGEFPYPIDTLDPAARRRITAPRRRGALPEGLFGCLSRALRGDPGARTGSMAELVRELRSLVPVIEAMVAQGGSGGAAASGAVRGEGEAEAAASGGARGAVARGGGGLAAVVAFVLMGGGVAAGGLWAAGFWETGGQVVGEEGEGGADAVEAEAGAVAVTSPAVAGSAEAGAVAVTSPAVAGSAGAGAEQTARRASADGGAGAAVTRSGEAGAGRAAAPAGAGAGATGAGGRCGEAEAFVGGWEVETTATKDTEVKGRGLKGGYRLDVGVDAATCAITVQVEKYRMGETSLTPPRQASVRAEIARAKGKATLVLRNIELAPMTYSMWITREGSGLGGRFEGEGEGPRGGGHVKGAATVSRSRGVGGQEPRRSR